MKGNLSDFKTEVEHTIKNVLRSEYLSDIAHAIGYMPSEKVNNKAHEQGEVAEIEGR